ncbi:MAG: SGNH/GDSL hydrolase family protein [Myxococcota bacterium]
MDRWLRALTVALGCASLLGTLGGCFGEVSGRPDSFESDIAAFEERDRVAPPPRDAIVFVGSSSIRGWDGLEEDMAPLPVIERGFGGSHLEHVIANAHRIVTPYQPRIVVVYAGDNDLAAGSGKSPDDVVRDYRTLTETLFEALPGLEIHFLSIKPSRLRWDRWPAMREANRRIALLSAKDPRLHYVDLATPLLDADGEPRDDVFVFDGLHLNETGYAAWAAVLKPLLLEAYERAAPAETEANLR